MIDVAKRILTVVISILIVFLLAGAMYFGYLFFSKNAEYDKEDEEIAKIAQSVFHVTDDEEEDDETTPEKKKHHHYGIIELDTTEIERYDYSVLKAINEDCIGWVRIKGTEIDFPVVWKEHNNTFYLNHDIYQDYASHGTPFLDGNMNPDGQMVIHGHNMTDGHFFAPLLQYRDPDFLKEHPVITLFLYEEKYEYEIFAVTSFDSLSDYTPYEIPIKEYPNKVEAYINKMRYRSFYDIDADVSPEDPILVLSTCEYSHNNGRFIVIAHRLPSEKEEEANAKK